MSVETVSVIDVLRHALAAAERGEMTAIAIATCHADLSTASAWCMEAATISELLGAVAILQSRLIDQTRPG